MSFIPTAPIESQLRFVSPETKTLKKLPGGAAFIRSKSSPKIKPLPIALSFSGTSLIPPGIPV